mmetsp:Transcript_17635/g.43397  ORF Transcript_17635/g.43397 Transcript_17635/m.43397 type:complete len:215 (-) Transcript_17635:2038-2682(-)
MTVGRSPVPNTQLPPFSLNKGTKLIRWVPKLTSFFDWTEMERSCTTVNETSVPSPRPTNSISAPGSTLFDFAVLFDDDAISRVARQRDLAIMLLRLLRCFSPPLSPSSSSSPVDKLISNSSASSSVWRESSRTVKSSHRPTATRADFWPLFCNNDALHISADKNGLISKQLTSRSIFLDAFSWNFCSLTSTYSTLPPRNATAIWPASLAVATVI